MLISKVITVVGISAAVCGCGTSDNFGLRATEYNKQAEITHSQITLLNILRAAYRKPLEFTTLTGVSGTSSISGGLGATLPLAGPASGQILSPTLSASGGPTFTVSGQNTQEFYQGILAQVTPQIIANYLQQGRPRKVLLTYLIDRITISTNGLKASYDNSGGNEGKYLQFQSVLNDLIDSGITVEPQEHSTDVGPQLPGSAFSPEAIAKLITSDVDIKKTRNGRFYQLGRTRTTYNFCFNKDLRVRPGTSPIVIDGKEEEGVLRVSPSLIEARSCNGEGVVERPKSTDSLQISLRSTVGLIAFVGEIARNQLSLDGASPSVPKLYFRTGQDGRGTETDTLFQIRRGSSDESLTTSYGGSQFSVGTDPTNRDHSTTAIELIETLLALNSSAKDTPSPNVITLVGGR